ncbi:hypothetical protein ASF53_21025 [Methylobacterium sp. Leaf123]|uniref:hypothetical protein n=1 Tax=Methylobacterium sp. Leaf123 TaxID=1736264 RepID=UPI0006F8FA68|nr:hypothetical protein [Methylobacterium sp. Leaf123]KQQ26418.1 hypothetical protein ASF53_21025 [Methylobacterium sp. Leaf123]
MGTITIWALFALFGGVCARYVSVIGFVLTALGIVAFLALMNALTGSDTFGAGVLAGGFVALQVGYFVGLLALVLARHLARLLFKKDLRPVEKGDLHIKHD